MLPMTQFIGGGEGAAAYAVANSLRLNANASAYLTRTPAGAATSRRKFTLSFWMKRGRLGNGSQQNGLWFAGNDLSAYEHFYLREADDFQVGVIISGSSYGVRTSAVYRDPSAWYHFVIAVDTTQVTAADRIIIQVNNVRQTVTTVYSGYPPQNTDLQTNHQSVAHYFTDTTSHSAYFDGFIAQVHMIDGQALAPSSFGVADANSAWTPKAYSGTYGNNGFYLKFANSGSLGADSSGNGNVWTLNNITSVDQCGDTPSANYCTLSPLMNTAGITLSTANLKVTGAGSWKMVGATFGMTSGKWYWEQKVSAYASYNHYAGVIQQGSALNNWLGATGSGWSYESNSGKTYANAGGAGTAYGSSWTTVGDVIGVAFDADNGKLWFAKNGTWQASGDPAGGTNAAFSGLTSGPYFPAGCVYDSGNADLFNFGQFAFAHTPPSGFKALGTANLPNVAVKKPASHHNIVTRGGSGSGGASVTGVGFSPDIFFCKARGTANDPIVQDTARGATKYLNTDTVADQATDGTTLSAFDGDGYTFGGQNGMTNYSGRTYVDWLWKKGATQGVDVVTWTGNGTNGRTIAHSLGATPKLIIIKTVTGSGSGGWIVYHVDVGATKHLKLNSTGTPTTSSTHFNNTAPNASNFTVGTDGETNYNTYTYVAYLFAEVPGFSKFGSFDNLASTTDNAFLWCGFRPRWLLIKCATSGSDWHIFDAARDPCNPVTALLHPNTSGVEDTSSAYACDFVANGVKWRGSAGATYTYVYAAFAELPFGGSNVNPSPAR